MTDHDDTGRQSGTPFTPGEIAGTIPPMVGRDYELHQLLSLLYSIVEQGGSQIATVVGLPGLGKSRLAYEFQLTVARLPESATLFSLPADEQSAAQPYRLVRQLVDTLFQIHADEPTAAHTRLEHGVAQLLGDDSLPQAQTIGQLVGYEYSSSQHIQPLQAEPRALRDQALHYLAGCLSVLAARTPLVLQIDDLHYADDGSLDALFQLAQEVPGLLLVGFARPQLYERRPDWGRGHTPAQRIDLRPLESEALQRLLDAILRQASSIPGSLRSLIASRTEGHPFYVEELIKLLIGDGVIVPGLASWEIRPERLGRIQLPNTLEELLRTRLLGLPSAARSFLAQAAVVGPFFSVAAAQQLAAGANTAPPDAELLHYLERQEIIVPVAEPRIYGLQEYAFRHDLLYRIAYAQVPPALLPRYHAQVASWLIAQSGEQTPIAAGLIAGHLEQGGQPRQAAEWYWRAGEQARTTYALEAASQHYQAALRLLADDPTAAQLRLECYAGLGQVEIWVARLNSAIEVYRQMAALAEQTGDTTAAARAWTGLASVLPPHQEFAAVMQHAQRAVALAEQSGDAPQLADSLLRLAWCYFYSREPQTTLELCQRALAVLTDTNEDLLGLINRATGLIGASYEQLGNYALAKQHLLLAVEQQRASSDLNGLVFRLNDLGYVNIVIGDFAAAVTALQEGRQIAQRLGLRRAEIYLLSNLSTALNGMDDHTAAEREAQLGLALCKRSYVPVSGELLSALAMAYLGQGRLAEAHETAQQALEAARADQWPWDVGTAWRVLGLSFSALNDTLGALTCFSESARVFTEIGANGDLARTLRAWALHELRHGDLQHARELWNQAHTLFTAADLTHELARTPASLPVAAERG